MNELASPPFLLISIPQAAKHVLLDHRPVSPRRLRRAAERQELRAVFLGGRWYTTVEWLREWCTRGGTRRAPARLSDQVRAQLVAHGVLSGVAGGAS